MNSLADLTPTENVRPRLKEHGLKNRHQLIEQIQDKSDTISRQTKNRPPYVKNNILDLANRVTTEAATFYLTPEFAQFLTFYHRKKFLVLSLNVKIKSTYPIHSDIIISTFSIPSGISTSSTFPLITVITSVSLLSITTCRA